MLNIEFGIELKEIEFKLHIWNSDDYSSITTIQIITKQAHKMVIQ